MARVITIPATLNKFTAEPVANTQKRKVAGYARVSTDHEEQATSYEAQVDYYTSYIKSRGDWEFAGLYSDEGISATNTKYRDGFNQMIEDALAGRIDLIITKSVSRFARNTVDSLTTIRLLKEHNVECYFEKENIRTFDSKGELLLTIMSSLAQEESRSISENVTWGQRKRFADGKVSVPYGRFLGYDRGEDGNLVVNEAEAVIVRRIYSLFLEGLTPYAIAKKLTAEHIPTPGGKTIWRGSTVRSILQNEKYKGDALLQKVFTTDFLSKKKKKNEGEVPQYYVEGNHEAIISPEVFSMVQAEMEYRANGTERYSGVGIFSCKLKCGDCGKWYGAKVWQSSSKYRRVVYQCNGKFKNEKKCATPHLTEDEIKELFIRAVNELLTERDEIIANLEVLLSGFRDITALEIEKSTLIAENEALVSQINACIAENTRTVQDQDDYNKRVSALMQRYDDTKKRYTEIETEIANQRIKADTVQMFISTLQSQQNVVTEFDEGMWGSLLEYATVYGEKCVVFLFRDGTEIKI